MSAEFQNIEEKVKLLRKYLQRDVYKIIGIEAVNWFKNSFQNQGFTDSSLKKWENVERKNKNSGWYGFKYGSQSPRPGSKKRNAESITNYSKAATTRSVLTGETQELMNSIQYRVLPNSKKVLIYSDKIYAEIHNNGGEISVFGKSKARIPKRQFMGSSKKLVEKIESIIKQDINKILN